MPDETASRAAESGRVLREEILQDARTRAEREVKRAERDAAKVIERAQRRAQRTRDQAATVAQQRADNEAAKARIGIRAEITRRQLNAQEQAVHAVYRRALEQAAAKEGCDYAAVLRAFAADAVRAMAGDAFALHFAAGDGAVHGEAVAVAVVEALRADGRDVTVRVGRERHHVSGGVIVESDDGSQVFDNTFEGRLNRAGDDLRDAVAGIIFDTTPDASRPDPGPHAEGHTATELA